MNVLQEAYVSDSEGEASPSTDDKSDTRERPAGLLSYKLDAAERSVPPLSGSESGCHGDDESKADERHAAESCEGQKQLVEKSASPKKEIKKKRVKGGGKSKAGHCKKRQGKKKMRAKASDETKAQRVEFLRRGFSCQDGSVFAQSSSSPLTGPR